MPSLVNSLQRLSNNADKSLELQIELLTGKVIAGTLTVASEDYLLIQYNGMNDEIFVRIDAISTLEIIKT